MKNFHVASFALLLLLFTFGSCQKTSTHKKLSNKNTQLLSKYVAGYTSGLISRTRPILIRLANSQEVEVGSKADPSLVKISPNIKGELIWKDARTLSFIPKEMLPSDKKYRVTMNLKKLFGDVPGDLANFEFEFATRPMHAFMTTNPPVIEAKNNTVLVSGSISTTDVVVDTEVENFLVVKGITKPTVKWTHGSTHEFVVSNLTRKKKGLDISFTWNGKKMGMENLHAKVELPRQGTFRVFETRLDNSSTKPSVKVFFSDIIKKNQNFDGLVKLKGYSGALKYWVEGSVLSVYPQSNLEGRYQVAIKKGIVSSTGAALTENYTTFMEFEKREPQLRVVGRGVIMPKSGDHVFFPFEAVALKYVNVEVFKIFSNNVMQFLQVNEPDGFSDMERVGRIIYQKKVALKTINPDADASIWTRYALDLSTIIDQDPTAVYQVRIAFQPSYGENPCFEEEDEEENSFDFLPVDQREDVTSIMGDYYSYRGYFSNYDWSDRDNPCEDEYCNAERFIKRNIFLSDMGIIAKEGSNKEMFLSITDLKTTKAMAGVDVEFFDYQQQSILTGKTDEDGVFHSVLPRTAYFVKAKASAKVGYLRLAPGQNLSVSRFDVDGAIIQEGTKGFIYGDRGVWRPGDSLFLNFVLVKEDGIGEKYPVTLTLMDARDNVYLERTESKNIDGLYSFSIATQADAPTGYWRAIVNAGGSDFYKTLRVETIKPNRLKMVSDIPEKLTSSNANRHTTLQINWLHGAPASFIDVQVNRQFQNYKTKFPNYNDFTFDDPVRHSNNYQVNEIFQGKTDESGKASFTDEIADGDDFPGMMKVAYSIKATEKGGDFSTDNFSVVYSPFSSYAGLMIPKQYGYKKFNLDEENPVRIVCVDENGKPIAGRKLELNMYRLSWSWWWDSDDDYVSRFNNSDYASPVESIKLITNSKGQATWSVTPPDWGRYLVRVYDPKNNQSSGEIAYAGYPWGDSQSREQLQAAAMLPLEPEKKKYDVGDKVQVKVPTGKAGHALITIEKGGTIVSAFRRESKDGNNVFSFTATEDMVPNIYVSVSMVQPHANTGNDLPMRMYGIVPIKIEDPKARLEPKIATAAKWEPDSDISLTVSEAQGRSMAYTISIVDDGLLDLTRFKTPSPYQAFNAKEALGVKTWDVYDYILGAFNGDNNRILAIGGDDDEKEVDKEKSNNANRFKPVVLHFGPFKLKKGEKAKHKFHFPNYVGSVRAMVVAVADHAYGSTDVTVPVRKPLMVQPTLPRVLGSGEKVMLPVTVFAMEEDVKDVKVTVTEKSGLVTFPEGNTKNIRFNKLGDQVVYFPVNIKEAQGTASFKIQVKSGRHVAFDEIEISIRNPNPLMSDVEEFALQAGESTTHSVSPYGVAGSNKTVIEVASVPPLNLGKRLDYLIRYPHGCIEQTTSSVFPQLFVDALIDMTPSKQKKVETNIKAGIDRLKLFQVGSGGFSYWPGEGDANAWGSNYAGHFLVEAKAKGYVVPDAMMNGWINFQTDLANNWEPNSRAYGFSYFDQAYRLHTLALAGKPLKGAMNRLRNDEKLPNMARWQLAAAYAIIGKKDVGKAILNSAHTDIEKYAELGYSYGSPLRDKSMALQTLDLLGMSNKSLTLLKDISKSLSAHSWYSTHSTAYGLLALSKYYANHKPSKLVYTVSINGKNQSVSTEKPISSHAFAQADKTQSFSVKNTSNGELYVRVIRTGKPKEGEEQRIADSDLGMKVIYRDLKGNLLNPSSLPRGKDFYAEVTITNPGSRFDRYENMALTQIFPSGWEISNSRMSDVQVFDDNSSFDYQDIRDDRVYTYFDVSRYHSVVYRVLLNAAYPGKYYLPATYCEAMYDNTIRAATEGQWVQVIDKKKGI